MGFLRFESLIWNYYCSYNNSRRENKLHENSFHCAMSYTYANKTICDLQACVQFCSGGYAVSEQSSGILFNLGGMQYNLHALVFVTYCRVPNTNARPSFSFFPSHLTIDKRTTEGSELRQRLINFHRIHVYATPSAWFPYISRLFYLD